MAETNRFHRCGAAVDAIRSMALGQFYFVMSG